VRRNTNQQKRTTPQDGQRPGVMLSEGEHCRNR